MICGYYLYFISHCIVEAMHVHASDRHLTESGSAKLFVMGNGDTIVKEQGVLTNKELRIIREFIKDNYQEMPHTSGKWGYTFFLCVGHNTDLVGSNPTADIYRQAKRTTSRCQ